MITENNANKIGELISQAITDAETRGVDLPMGIPPEVILQLMELTEGSDEHSFESDLFSGTILRQIVGEFGDTLTIEFKKMGGKLIPEGKQPAWRYDEEEVWWIRPIQ